ncbi:MAG: hypothetical protein M1286_02000 [Candidatus Marsarchaeota archaeon]|nr:hypothetical protein [Candidatus Marsarchaeota archaeon]
MVSLRRKLAEQEAKVLEATVLAAKYPGERFTILLGLVREQEGVNEFDASMKDIHKAFYEVGKSHPKVLEGVTFDTRIAPWSVDLERSLGSMWVFSGQIGLDMLDNSVTFNPSLWSEAESLLAVKYDTREEEDEFRAAAHELAVILKPRKQ